MGLRAALSGVSVILTSECNTRPESLSKPRRVLLDTTAGQAASIETAGAGGYGDPAARPEEQIDADVRDGRVSAETAQRYRG